MQDAPIALSRFARRQLEPSYAGLRLHETDVARLIAACATPCARHPGYADFNQVLTLRNRQTDGSLLLPQARCLVMPRQEALAAGGMLHTAYEARTAQELPVLTEWVSGLRPPEASCIHVVLYSAAQMRAEGEDPGSAAWLIVSIQSGAQDTPPPMHPITLMRNALGISEGGSGQALDRQAYLQAADYWARHISLRD